MPSKSLKTCVLTLTTTQGIKERCPPGGIDESQTKLGKQMQALTLKIETLMRAQAQVPITTPLFPTCDKCRIMHGPRKCTIDDKLTATMNEINFVGGEEMILITNTITISIKDKASD